MKDIYSSYIKNPITPKKNSIKGVIIHNDAGSMTPSQYLNWLNGRVRSGQIELGFAALYVNRNECLWFSPTDYAEWHAGNQYGNYNFIGFEVCESFSASNANFLANEEATLKKAAAVMESYNLKPNRSTVMLHNEFSSTACPHRSWELHVGKGAPYTQANKNILKDYFIGRIKHYMGNSSSTPAAKPAPSKPAAKPTPSKKKSVSAVAKEVIAGKWGTGNARFNALKKAGYNAQAVQNEVNRQLGAKPVKAAPKKKSNATIVNEVIAGKWGTGNDRFNRLKKAGYNPTTIQNAVNKKLGAGSSKPAKKSIDTVAREVIAGQWGNGNARFNSLRKAGYNPDTVQRRVNQLL